MTRVKRTNIAWYESDLAAIAAIRSHLETTRPAGSKAPTETDAIRHALHAVAAELPAPTATAPRRNRTAKGPTESA